MSELCKHCGKANEGGECCDWFNCKRRENQNLKAENAISHEERQQLRGVLHVEQPPGPCDGTCITDFDPQPTLLDAAKMIVSERNLLKQVSGEVCDRCGWATVFPPDPCALCENEKLQAENARLKAELAEWLERLEAEEAAPPRALLRRIIRSGP